MLEHRLQDPSFDNAARTPSQRSILALVRRADASLGFRAIAAADALEPEETAELLLFGDATETSPPLLILTDRRLLRAQHRLMGWRTKWDLRRDEISGVQVLKRRPMIPAQVQIVARRGRDRRFDLSPRQDVQEALELVRTFGGMGR